jgi:AsmA protein
MKPVKKKPPAKKASAAQPENTGTLKASLLGLYGVIGLTLSALSLTTIKLPFAEGFAKDHWRHALAGLMVVLAMLGALLGTALYMLDANDFKSQIVDYVKTNKQRDLVLQGNIELTFFPKLGLDCGKMTLSQRNSTQKFASVDNARLYIAWWPLFMRQVEVERIALDGLHANVIRYKDGSTNLDDLLSSDGRVADIKFEIDKIRIDDSSINLRDEASDLTVSLHDLNLETGRIKSGVPGDIQARFRLESGKPRIKTEVKLGSHLLFDRAAGRYELANLNAQVQGEAGGISNLDLHLVGTLAAQPATRQMELDKFSAALTGRLENRKLETKLDVANLKLDKSRLLGTALLASAKLSQGQESQTASLDVAAFDLSSGMLQTQKVLASFDLLAPERGVQGQLSTPLSYNIERRELQLPAIDAAFSASHPWLAGKLKVSGSGEFKAKLVEQHLKLDFKSRLDESQFAGNIQVQDFKSPQTSFDVVADSLDLDRYLAIDWGKRMQDASAPLDFSAIKSLNLRGNLRSSGDFKFARLKSFKPGFEIRADQSSLNIELLQAQLYEGSGSGSLSITAAPTPQISFKQKLLGVQLDALLADLMPGEPRLVGKGNLNFDVSADGGRLSELRKTLSGNASLALGRGSLAGLNLGEALLAGKDQLGLKDAQRSESARMTENTAFSELRATFDFSKGQARNNDVLLKSPNFSVKGEGTIAVDSGQLNYRVSTTVAPGLTRGGAGELAELSGITIPLRVSGAPASASVTFALGEASGGNLARLAKLNLARAGGAAEGGKVAAGK